MLTPKGPVAAPGTTPSTIQSEPEDYTHMSLLKLHELATANKLVERYEKVEDKEGGSDSKSIKVNKFITAIEHQFLCAGCVVSGQ